MHLVTWYFLILASLTDLLMYATHWVSDQGQGESACIGLRNMKGMAQQNRRSPLYTR